MKRKGKNPFKNLGKKRKRISYSAKKARAGKDIGKKGKNFSKIEEAADKRYGKGHGAKVAGAVLTKLRKEHGG